MFKFLKKKLLGIFNKPTDLNENLYVAKPLPIEMTAVVFSKNIEEPICSSLPHVGNNVERSSILLTALSTQQAFKDYLSQNFTEAEFELLSSVSQKSPLLIYLDSDEVFCVDKKSLNNQYGELKEHIQNHVLNKIKAQ